MLIRIARGRPLAAVALALPLLAACSRHDGRCDGAVGAVGLQAVELGEDTALYIRGGANGREAALRLDAAPLRLTADITLPAKRDGTHTLALQGSEAAVVPGAGAFRRVRVDGPTGAPAVEHGLVELRQEGATGLAGTLFLDFQDGTRTTCVFDVDGKSSAPGDALPGDPNAGQGAAPDTAQR